MNASVVDIKQMITHYYGEDSYAGTLYPIFIGKEPATPTDTITIFETVGFHQLTMDKCEKYEYPSIQIRVRSTAYLEGWQMIADIKDILHGRANETWNGALYTLIRCSGGPALLDYDKDQRCRFIANFLIQRR
jgi:hypothetical protein